MRLEIIKPNKSLNKSYFKQNLKRTDIDLFKTNLSRLFSRMDEAETEEHNKNCIADFLKDTYYRADYELNTSGRKDLVVHIGKSNTTAVGVIIEAKRPGDKAGMISELKPNEKALHELIHYYLDERLIKNNKEVRSLVVTDCFQWYIFDAAEFERLFVQNNVFMKSYLDWSAGILPSKYTDWFYQEIAKPFVENEIELLECTYFDLHEFETIIKNEECENDSKLIHLYKILSPQHLLKLPIVNDSNVLNSSFYNELLHIIGLCEQDKNGIKTIERLPKNQRLEGSLLENTIEILKTYDKLSNLSEASTYGKNADEQLFSVALELCLTWLNRILFLKLLEGQLIKYNKDNSNLGFLNSTIIKDFGDLSELFFDVLAVKINERSQSVQAKYANIPYLNSSLFEISFLERHLISINQLKDRFDLPIFSATVFKEQLSGEKLIGSKPTLVYLLEFLDAYNFASENSAKIQEQNKTIINASVLGLIFEKINGYKDGSFFTPGYITMYICRETIRKTVVQKFNTSYHWNCTDIDSLINLIDRAKLQEYNDLFNTIRICDPSVGSGHFLVSALNEMIAIKSELGILLDRNGKTLRYLDAVVENDLLVFYDDNEYFEYQRPILKTANGRENSEDASPHETQKQIRQEAIFQEKQTIIENCLFGVDINPKSVQICQLRLWIELLKHAYYTKESKYTELETLPNIDINIKCGNSLVSRFGLNGVTFTNGQAQKMKLETKKYKDQVVLYKSTSDKITRRKAEKEIERIKEQFSAEVNPNDEDLKKIRQKQAELSKTPMLFNIEEKANWESNVLKLSTEIETLEKIYKEKDKSFYGNAFEWRFEFPEVLDEQGNFVGFDLVVGNPPYFQIQYADFDFKKIKNLYKTFEASGDIYSLFIEKAAQIIKTNSIFSFIVSNRFCNTNYGQSTRQFLSQLNIDILLNINAIDVFEKANVGTLILVVTKQAPKENNQIVIPQFDAQKPLKQLNNSLKLKTILTNQKYFNEKQWIFKDSETLEIKEKMDKMGVSLKNVADLNIKRGIVTGSNNIFIISNEIKEFICNKDSKSIGIIRPLLKGKHIKKYYTIPSIEWIIFTRRGVDIKNYPAVEEYLVQFKEELTPGIGRKRGLYKWFEIQDNIAYFKDFEKEKIIWPQLASESSFSISTKKEYSLNSTSIATGKNLKYYCAILNSKAVLFYFKMGSVIWGKDGIKWFGDFFDHIPVPVISELKQKPFIKLVDKIIEQKDKDPKADTSQIENSLNTMVYQLYNLTPQEIKIIESDN